MRRVFADTAYWIALASPRDQLHGRAVQVSQGLQGVEIVTTEEVLTEFLTHFCENGPMMRAGAARYVEGAVSNPDIVVRSQSHQSFSMGFALYKARLDKGYSQTDCISMETMRLEGLTEALTSDHHFVQEGFVCLF